MKLDNSLLYYVAAPLTSFGTIRENRRIERRYVRKLKKVQKKLGVEGLKLIRPLDIIPVPLGEEESINKCISLLRCCDALILCKNWEYSSGCRIELDNAVDAGLQVFYMEEILNS